MRQKLWLTSLLRYKWIAISILLTLFLSIVVALRYKAALALPNFYAEDGTVFLQNIIDKGIVGATFTAFNGYLVIGQYLVIDAAYIIYQIFGLSFSLLPLLIALSSCLFLGLTASLPFILFRKELGWGVALITSVLLAFTPLYGSDYAVIGTIGNLKFAFLFWAVLFIIYRNIHYANIRKVILSDCVLLLCVLTNGPTVVLLPAILWPYRSVFYAFMKKQSVNLRSIFKRYDFLSALGLFLISFIYLVVVYVKGVPKIPNYLEGPYLWQSTDNILYRVTEYGWLYPFSKGLTAIIVIATFLIMLVVVFVINRRRRGVFLFGLISITISTLAFVVTRQGIGNYMLAYEKFPDQFFYAQAMVFVFVSMWVIASYVKTNRQLLLSFGLAIIYLLISTPFGSSYGANAALYSQRPGIYQAVEDVCGDIKEGSVSIPIYPDDKWNLTMERSIACK